MPSWSLLDSMVTTAFAVAAATLAKRPAGASPLPLVDSVTFEVVNASATSAVLRPITPPSRPMTNAISSRTSKAR